MNPQTEFCSTFEPTFHIGNDTTGDQTRNLTEEHLLAVGGSHDGRRPLVLGRGLRVPGHQETARMVLEVLHHAAYGHPVHVDVRDRHEDRDLQHLATEVLGLLHVLRHDDAPVARGEDQIGIVDPHPAGFAEKRHDEEPEEQQEHRSAPQQHHTRIALEQPVKHPPDKQANDARDADDLVAFLVYSHNSVSLRLHNK